MARYRQTGKMSIGMAAITHLPDPDLLKRLVITDSGFVFDPNLGKSYSVNSVGITILKAIQDGASLDQIIYTVTQDFSVSRETAERDILEFINSLKGQIK